MTAKPSYQANVYKIYLYFISGLGMLLVVYSISQASNFAPISIFLALLGVAILAEVSTTSLSVIGQASITFEVGTSMGIAALILFEPLAGVLIVATANFAIWLIKPAKEKVWLKSLPQFAFNNGMHTIAIFLAGSFHQAIVQNFGAGWGLIQLGALLITAVLYDQINLWLLVVILRLQLGDKVTPSAIWRENLWAMPINIVVLAVGGGIVAFAAQQIGILGVIIFALPILLSSYAFYLYVRQMRTHMNNLEQIVAERTGELQKRTEELDLLVTEKDSFLAVLTHDMKSPLTSLGLYAELLQKRPSLAIQKPQYIDNILRSQQTLSNIVEDILNLENLQVNGDRVLMKRPFALHEVVDYVTESINVQAGEKGIILETEFLVDESVVLHADRRQIERVLFNLITNAVKYTGQGGKITIKASKQQSQAEISVIDNGHGIPAAELPHIFEPYRRVDKHKHVAGGTGLGLAVTKAIVDAHGGNLSVMSQEGQGSVFTAQIPLG
ncbi:MAG: HAMP domain-containing sensor histidine kinase [Chloroflexota bacterium]